MSSQTSIFVFRISIFILLMLPYKCRCMFFQQHRRWKIENVSFCFSLSIVGKAYASFPGPIFFSPFAFLLFCQSIYLEDVLIVLYMILCEMITIVKLITVSVTLKGYHLECVMRPGKFCSHHKFQGHLSIGVKGD